MILILTLLIIAFFLRKWYREANKERMKERASILEKRKELYCPGCGWMMSLGTDKYCFHCEEYGIFKYYERKFGGNVNFGGKNDD